jgi:serine/threonine protein kinase
MIDLMDKYPGTEPEGLAILYQMLSFNPNSRISADEAISDPYFDEVRILEQEELEPGEISLPFDIEEVTEEEMRETLLQELKNGYDPLKLLDE